MINVNQMTSQLARMPDQALQQYAQMHKNDPYIMALAMSESNRRKSMRTGAQMNAPEEPKVVDQAIQGMASPMPEDVGIGQLPAGEMNFAGGGIVAFSDGGDVPRFQDRGLVENNYDRMNQLRNEEAQRNFTTPVPLPEEEPTRLPGESLDAYRSRLRAFKKTGIPNFIMRTPEQLQAGRREDYAARAASDAPTIGGPMANSAAQALPRNLPPAMPSAAETQMAMNAGAFKPPPAPPASPPAASGPGAGGPRPLAAAAAKPPVVPGAALAAPPQGGLPDLQKQYDDILAKQKYEDPAKANLAALTAKETAAAQDEKAALERDQARFAEVFKGREGRIGKREADISTQKDTNTSLALLNAGLAIMSTPGGLATALGKGAQVGTAQFAAGLDKIRSAQEKIDDARDRLEELRLNRDEMGAKEIRAAESKIRNVGVEAEKRVIDGLRQAGQINRAAATTVFTSTAQQGIAQLEIGGRENVANIGLQGQMAQAAATRDNAAATRALADNARMAALAESVRKNIADEAVKRFPYSTTDQATYQQQARQAALRDNPGLSQYLGVAGGDNAPSKADLRFNDKTGQFEPMR